MSSSMGQTPQVSLSGPLFIGAILNWALLGALIIQLYDYHSYFGKTERRGIKLVVYFVTTVEFLQTAFITDTVWKQVIGGWGDYSVLTHSPWSSTSTSLLNGIASATVQGFFAWRIRKFEKRLIGNIVSGTILLLALLQLSATLWVSIEFSLISRDVTNISRLLQAAELWLVGSFFCDLIITISMLTILLRARKNAHTRRTTSLLNRLTITTVETGAITTILALMQLVLYKVFPNYFYHVTVEFVVGRLYCNVLLATLNGRHRAVSENPTFNLPTLNFDPETELNEFSRSTGGGSVPKQTGHTRDTILSTGEEASAARTATDNLQAKPSAISDPDAYTKAILC